MASFCATGNQEKFLSDETGNRRWLCFLVSQIDDPRGWNLDYAQLYAQLRDEYHADFQHWFSQRDQKRVERQNDYFRIVSDEEELLTMRFRKPRRGDINIKHLKSATIAQMISYGRSSVSSRKVGLVLRKLGFDWSHTSSGNVYNVIELTPDQAQLELINSVSTSKSSETETVEQDLPF